ncbi:glycosyltransferase family protein [Bacillus safensis]|uniref:cytidylyltransferase domain-containing protein n=1 Tax=Bacillus TaxID=1386 RepID=UPI000412E8FA|nr:MULTISPECIES: glycosyltransferase family protein [Bacillus]TFV12716.1 spore coat protein [Bacillus stratosphericus]KAB3542362.1 NTP transferase domain-containing protein [Bacillus safensis]KAB3545603.1 NTP transferase domain-containing protein [Bacillus safensis]MBS4742806.1 spore coat protein [Bacillus safensis]MBZ9521252.1 glycosyltransferase family protein [Bacillus safensis]
MINDVLFVIQARMGSTRLPKKVMKPIGGMALIDLIVERVKQSDHYNHKTQNLMIATTVEAEDDLLAHYCLSKGYKVFRGSETDVLQRFAQIVRHFEPQTIVRLTGDNPFIDPVLLSKMLEKHRQEKADYTYTAGTPLGISGEMIDAQILSEIDNFPLTQPEREHVTLYIRKHPEQFHLQLFTPPKELAYPAYRFTIDTEEDYVFATRLLEKAGGSIAVPTAELITICEQDPDIVRLNQFVKQKDAE